MTDSLMSGFLHLEEISRQQIEQNVCCNLLFMQVVNLFKNLFLYRICSKLHGFKNSKLQNSKILGFLGYFESVDNVLVLSVLFFNMMQKKVVLFTVNI